MVPKALLVDDDPGTLKALAEWVGREGFTVQTATTLEEARARLEEPVPDVVLIDLYLPDGLGLELLDDLRDLPDTDVVIVTGQASINSAVDAMRGGAVDYLTKPIDLAHLRRILAQVARSVNLRDEIDALRGQLRGLGRFGDLVGSSSAMQVVYDQIERVAPTDTTILITGETGTGKEVAARTIHRLSRRARTALLPINCGAMPASLIESEIFGHEKGSFTGAEGRHPGIFERADGGTLLLDEITEMPLELQVKLLRILETDEVTRIGGTQPKRVNVRVISATNRDAEGAVAEGRLREDLLYRLNVFPIEMPPLRERGDDVDLLTANFLDAMNRKHGTTKRLAPDAHDRLRAHTWPGNVRELKNLLERAYIMASERIEAQHLPLERRVSPPPMAPDRRRLTFPVGTSLSATERALILATLAHHGGNKREAAEVLGVSLKTLYNRLKEYEAEGAGGAPAPPTD